MNREITASVLAESFPRSPKPDSVTHQSCAANKKEGESRRKENDHADSQVSEAEPGNIPSSDCVARCLLHRSYPSHSCPSEQLKSCPLKSQDCSMSADRQSSHTEQANLTRQQATEPKSPSKSLQGQSDFTAAATSPAISSSAQSGTTACQPANPEPAAKESTAHEIPMLERTCCDNCGVDFSPLWRPEHSLNMMLCNACSIWYRTKRTFRPKPSPEQLAKRAAAAAAKAAANEAQQAALKRKCNSSILSWWENSKPEKRQRKAKAWGADIQVYAVGEDDKCEWPELPVEPQARALRRRTRLHCLEEVESELGIDSEEAAHVISSFKCKVMALPALGNGTPHLAVTASAQLISVMEVTMADIELLLTMQQEASEALDDETLPQAPEGSEGGLGAPAGLHAFAMNDEAAGSSHKAESDESDSTKSPVEAQSADVCAKSLQQPMVVADSVIQAVTSRTVPSEEQNSNLQTDF